MTSPSPVETEAQERRSKRAHRAKHGLGVFVTDLELIEYLGVPGRTVRPVLAELDRHHQDNGFPQKQPMWGNRRRLASVEAWLELNYGLKLDAPRTRRAS